MQGVSYDEIMKQKGYALSERSDSKGFAPLLILIGILLLVGVGAGAYFLGTQRSSKAIPSPQQKACTEEGKQCPDGSYVSRVGPNCEFAQCPSPSPTPLLSDETANWQTYTSGKLTFKYPDGWNAKDFDYANSVLIENMASSVKITISEGQYPYGFAGLPEIKENSFKITVDGQEYQVTENILDNRSAYVDFELNTPQKHHVLFGTGYPAANDYLTSLDDYYSSKDIILKILATLKFQ